MSYLQQVVEMIVIFHSLLSNVNFYNLVRNAVTFLTTIVSREACWGSM